MNKEKYIAEVKETVTEITAEEVVKLDSARIVDVRDKHEFTSGHIDGAENLSRGLIELKAEERFPDKNTLIITCCGGGTRSALAADTLTKLGFTNVKSLRGGFRSWKECGLPTCKLEDETSWQERFSRHLSLEQIGEAGQKKLLKARVAVVGLGGLGCPAAHYLTLAGVGHLHLIDFDRVETGNLQRQGLFSESTIGEKKVDAAKFALRSLSSFSKITVSHEKLTKENSARLLSDVDVVIDCVDDYATRYVIDDTCHQNGTPQVYAAVEKFYGLVSVFNHPKHKRRYRDLFENAPENACGCSEVGVLGVVPGILGILQALEAIKLIADLDSPLHDSVLKLDLLQMSFDKLKMIKPQAL